MDTPSGLDLLCTSGYDLVEVVADFEADDEGPEADEEAGG